MALEVGRGTGTGIHAVLAVEALRTHLLAPCPSPACFADAHAVVLPAHLVVHAPAPLGTALTVSVRRTGLVAVGSRPTRQTLALPAHVVALATVLAVALELAARSVESGWAGMLAGETQVAGAAENFSSDVIAALVSCGM